MKIVLSDSRRKMSRLGSLLAVSLLLSIVAAADSARADEETPPQREGDLDVATVTLRGGSEAMVVFDSTTRRYRLCSGSSESSTKSIVVELGESQTRVPAGECVDLEVEGIRVLVDDQGDVARAR